MSGPSFVDSGLPRKESCGYPLKLDPIFQERVWGVEDLTLLYATRPAAPHRVGEVWLSGDDNRVANGSWSGTTLGELTNACGPALLGSDVFRNRTAGSAAFPLLVKFLFTTDKLSVQVHPPDSYARKREASAGKTEMWHVVATKPGARLAIGFREDITEKEWDRASLRVAVESGQIEQMLDWIQVREGETFFIPAGTVHAIGASLVLCEIQQNSDITYRLYDYNRPGTDGKPRPLHVEKALDVLQFHTPGGRTHPLKLATAKPKRVCLAACPYFVTEKWTFDSTVMVGSQRTVEVWIGLEGVAEFEAGGERVRCRKGEVVVTPAEMDRLTIHPLQHSVFLRTFPPDLDNYADKILRANSLSERELRGVYFPSAGSLPKENP